MSSFYGNGGGGGSSSGFNLSDRLAKGIDNQGNIVQGAIIQGLIEDIEINNNITEANKASGLYSHAEGSGTVSAGLHSHSAGKNTIANGQSQFVIGQYNTAQGTNNTKINTDYVFIIGNGINNNNRSNALGVKWNGNFVFADGTQITPAEFASLKTLNQDIESLLSAI